LTCAYAAYLAICCAYQPARRNSSREIGGAAQQRVFT
jgi:hypothetical protein